MAVHSTCDAPSAIISPLEIPADIYLTLIKGQNLQLYVVVFTSLAHITLMAMRDIIGSRP